MHHAQAVFHQFSDDGGQLFHHVDPSALASRMTGVFSKSRLRQVLKH
jgi:hypothetical protein